MSRFLDRICGDDIAYKLKASDDGYLLIRRDGHDADFNVIARDLIDHAGEEFAVFPTSDGRAGYERVFIIPL